jgi:hypothetical protein
MYYESQLAHILPQLCEKKRECCDSMQSLPFSDASDQIIDETRYKRKDMPGIDDVMKMLTLKQGSPERE